MATESGWLKIEAAKVVPAVQEALGKLDGGQCELLLDFSSVVRIDSRDLQAMESLAGAADKKTAKVVLHAVNVDVYRVLKLTQLAPRFSFLP
jgi:anti-anti-sigma regulatory factor